MRLASFSFGIIVVFSCVVLSGCGKAPSPLHRQAETSQLVNQVWQLESWNFDLSTRIFETRIYTKQQHDEDVRRGVDPKDYMNPPEIARRLLSYEYRDKELRITTTYDDYVNNENDMTTATSSWYAMEMKFLPDGRIDGFAYRDSTHQCRAQILGASGWAWLDSSEPRIQFTGTIFPFQIHVDIDSYVVSFENGKLVLTVHDADTPGLTGGYNEITLRAVFTPSNSWQCENGQPAQRESSVAAPTVQRTDTSYTPGGTEPANEPVPVRSGLHNAQPEASFTKDWNKETGVLRLDASASAAGFKYQWFFGWLSGQAQSPAATENPQMILLVTEHQLVGGTSAAARWIVLNLVDDSGKVYASQRQILE